MTIKADRHGFAVQAARPALSQTVTVGSSSTQSNAFSVAKNQGVYNEDGTPVTTNNTLHIRVCATTDVWIAFGDDPTAASATTPSIFLPSGVPEYFWVFPGEKLAVIQDSAAGKLSIAELVS